MATLEDLGRMAMVDVGEDTVLPSRPGKSGGWGKMVIMLAASAAVCGLVVGLQESSDREGSE